MNGMIEQVNALTTVLACHRQQLFELEAPGGDGEARVKNARDRLIQLHGQMEAEVNGFAASLRRLPPGHYGEDTWAKLASLTRGCRALDADHLAFDQTIRFRERSGPSGHNMSLDACDILIAADYMVEEFSRKTGKSRTSYVLLSQSAHFQPEISAIHLSYSGLSIWNLNRTAHEFAHQWGEEYSNGDEGAQRAFVENIQKPEENDVANKEQEAFAKELFADLIATFMTGPAYAYSCLLLDFNPINRRSSSTHPSHDERAHLILMVLCQLVREMPDESRPRMRGLIADLQQYWSDARQASGAGGLPETLKTLQAEVPIALNSLKREIPNAQFKDPGSSFRVKMALLDRQRLTGNSDLGSILNGAWLARLETKGDELEDLERAALCMLLDAEGAIEQAR